MLRWIGILALLALLIYYRAEVVQITSIIFSVPLNIFFTCLLLVIAEFVLQAWRMKLVFHGEWKETIKTYALGHFVAFSVPNRALGEMARVGAFAKALNVPVEDAMAYVGIERLLDVTMLLGTGAYLIAKINAPAGALLAVGVLAMVVSLESEEINRIFSRLPGFLGKYFKSARTIIKRRRLIIILLLLTVILWLIDYLRVWIIVHTFGGKMSYWSVASLVALTYIVAIASFLPGGLVVWEGGLTAGLTLSGMPLEKALAATLFERFFSYWLWIAVGAFAWSGIKKNSKVQLHKPLYDT